MSASCATHVTFLWLALASFAAHEQTQTRDGVVAHLRVEAERVGAAASDESVAVSLSGELVLTLTVEAPAAIALAPLPEITASKAWRQRDPVKGWETTPLADGRVRRQQTYRLAPWQVGEVPLALLPLKYRKARGPEEWEEIAWKPLPVLVTTIIQDSDLRSVRDITGVEELPPLEQSWLGWIILAAGLTVGLLALAGWFVRRRRARALPPPPPDVWALSELAGLREPAPTSAAQVEQFHTRLSAIVRRYLELRFGFHAPRQTTPEFLEAARESPLLTPEQQALLGELLVQCDLAKFARTQPTPEECRAEVARARAFVEESRPASAGQS